MPSVPNSSLPTVPLFSFHGHAHYHLGGRYQSHVRLFHECIHPELRCAHHTREIHRVRDHSRYAGHMCGGSHHSHIRRGHLAGFEHITVVTEPREPHLNRHGSRRGFFEIESHFSRQSPHQCYSAWQFHVAVA